jgi:2-aminoadipate transaminase
VARVESVEAASGPHGAVPELSARARRAGAAYAGPGSGPAPAAGRAGALPTIAFTAGLPDAALLPAAALTGAAGAVLAEAANSALQYGGAQGWPGLREWLAGHSRDSAQVALSPEHFSLTNGSAGALANVCETFLDTGDVAGVESLSFPLSVRTIRSITPRIESIPVDAGGLDVDALEARLGELAARGDRMRLLYVIPTFHNPTGSTLTLERRRRLVELCSDYDVLIVEDDAYGELWFREEPPPSLYALAGGVGVVKIGTFSKIVAPGLRVGWCQADPATTAALVATRCDMGTSPLLMHVLDRLGREGFLDGHIARVRGVYADKCDVASRALAVHCGAWCRWEAPEGGFFIWVEAGERVDPAALAAAALDEAVSFVGGHVFAAEQAMLEGPRLSWVPGNSRSFRLAFSSVPSDEIEEGIRRLGHALKRAVGTG